MKQLDFDRAFPKTPDCVHAAIEMGFRKGQKQMKMRNKIIGMASIAAAIAIMIAVAAFATGGLGTPPQPDVLAQPKVTDMPKNEEAIHVYSTEGSTFYHLKPDCSGMENAVEMNEIEAIRMGKQACPMCIPMTCNGHNGEEIEYVYYSQGAKHFHKQEECSGGSFDLKGEFFTVTRVFPGKEPCTTCFPNGIEECVHGRAFIVEPEPTPSPEPAETGNPEKTEYVPLDSKKSSGRWEESKTDSSIVYTAYGKSHSFYHNIKNCGGKDYRRELTEDQAIHENLQACLACSFRFVYYTEHGKYCHSDAECIGMMNASAHPREDARRDGKLPCPICLMVYANEDGLYYHMLSGCMGQDDEFHTLEEAYAMGNRRCPICLSPETVYATKLGNYFHAVQDCSGMKDASATTPETEWGNGKLPCPVCIAENSAQPPYGNEAIANRATEQSEISIRLPEHHELFEKAFGKSINTLFPGCYFSFESWDVNDENADNRVWMLKNSADPNEEAFAGLIEYAPGVGGYDGYRLRVNLSDNLPDGNHINNAHDFLRDAYFWFGDIQVSLRNLCNYAQLGVNVDEIQMQEGMEYLLAVAGVMVYFNENEDVCGYDVRYYYNGTDAYILRTTIGTEGSLYWELLEGEVWK